MATAELAFSKSGNELHPNQKRVMFTRLIESGAVSPQDVDQVEDGEITYDYMVSHGVRALDVTAAGLGPLALKQRGAKYAYNLRRLGFSALHLACPEFAHELVLAFGADEVASAFLVSPHDAISVAGSSVFRLLDVGASSLLELCAGSPNEAKEVLKQLDRQTERAPATSLKGVSAKVLLDTGLRHHALRDLGYSLTRVAEQTGASSDELLKLGFGLTFHS